MEVRISIHAKVQQNICQSAKKRNGPNRSFYIFSVKDFLCNTLAQGERAVYDFI